MEHQVSKGETHSDEFEEGDVEAFRSDRSVLSSGKVWL